MNVTVRRVLWVNGETPDAWLRYSGPVAEVEP